MNTGDEFSKGFICACAVTYSNHRNRSIVEHTLRCNFLTIPQMRKIGVPESDIETLKPVIKEILRKQKLI
jgi:hypothetical protein